MASLSLQIKPGFADYIGDGANVTAGTAAPTTGTNIEVRIDLASTWNVHQVRLAFEQFMSYLQDPELQTSLPQV